MPGRRHQLRHPQGDALCGLSHSGEERPSLHRRPQAEGGDAPGRTPTPKEGLQALRHGRHGEVPHRERRGEHPPLLAQRGRTAASIGYAAPQGDRHGGEHPQEPYLQRVEQRLQDSPRVEQRLQDSPRGHRPEHPADYQRTPGQRLHQCVLHDVGG